MSDAITTIKQAFEARKQQIADLLPKHMTADRLLVVALNCIQKTPKLQECTASSLLNSIRIAAELGLEPGGALGQLYLVPFNDRKTDSVICTPIIGYRGFAELMRRSGEVEQMEAHVVHQGDVFEIEYGLTPKLRHVPRIDGEGKPTLAYVIIRLKDGGVHVEMMSAGAINKIRARSRSANDGPWVTDEEEMWKKTVFRRAAKWSPLQSERIRQAIEHDDTDYVDGALASPALPADTQVTQELISGSNERAKEKIRNGRKLTMPEEVTTDPAGPGAESPT